MNTERVCPSYFLSDAPSPTDELGGTHAAIAKSLVQLCLTSEGGRIVGLEGHWGSGKSTVLTLMSEAFSRDANTVFLNFDAWSHEADPLRRVFLERLATALDDEGWIDSGKWTARVEQLSGQRRRTRIEKHQKLTTFGKRLAVAVAVAPTGLAFLGPEWRINDPRLWLAWGVALAPVLVTGWHWLNRSQDEKENVWSLLVQNQTAVEESETTETPEPNSVEFERAFTELVSEALLQPHRRLIISFDNLDRISANTALQVWATLQAFVSLSHTTNRNWFGRVWFVVPYDPDALTRLWNPGEGAGNGLAEAFMTKAFSLRFTIPPVLLADWRKYLQARLLAALPSHSSDAYSVSRIYALERPNPDRPPTPREITNFVNHLSALHHHRGHSFPLADLAYFAVVQRKVGNIESLLLAKQLPSESVSPFVSERVQESLAGLCFGTSPEAAQQHLLREPIEQALQIGDSLALEGFKQVPGFWHVLESVESAQWLADEGKHTALAAFALGKAGILEQDRPEVHQLRLRLAAAGSHMNSWTSIDTQVAQGLVEIAKLGGPSRLSPMVESINRTAEGKDILSSLDWLRGLRVFLDGIEAAGLKLGDGDAVRLPTGGSDWMDACFEMCSQEWPLETIRKIVPERSPAEVAKIAAEEVTSQFSERAVATARVMAACRDLYDSSPLPTGVYHNLRSGAEIGPDMLEQQLRILEVYPPETDEDPSVDLLLQQGWLHHHLDSYFRKNDDEGISAILQLLFPTHLPLSQPPAVGNSVGGYQKLTALLKTPSSRPSVVAAMAQRLDSPSFADAWFDAVERDPSASELLQSILKQIASAGSLAQTLAPERVFQSWAFLEATFSTDEGQVDGLLVQYAQEIVHLLESTEFHLDNLSLYERAGALFADRLATSGFPGRLQMYLQTLTPDDWLGEIREGGNLLNLIGAIQGGGATIRLPLEFREAARANARELLQKRGTAGPVATWDIVDNALEPEARSVLRDWIFEDVPLFSDGSLQETFLASYARLFEDEEWLSGEKRLSQNLVRPIVAAQDPRSLKWLLQNAQAHPGIFTHLPRGHVIDLLEKIESALESATEEARQLLADLKKVVNKARTSRGRRD